MISDEILKKFKRNCHPNLKYLIGFFFTLIALSSYKYQLKAVRSSLGFKAEMWAEGATNYFDCIEKDAGFLYCLMQTDAGYLAFLPRLWSQLISAFNVKYELVAIFQQFFAIATLVICCASVCLKLFETIYGPYILRLLLAFILASHFDYELHTFINSSYYLIIPTSSFLCILLAHGKLKNTAYILTGTLVAITTLSKGIFICLFPMAAFVSLNLAYRKLWKQCAMVFTPAFAAFALQTFTMFNSYNKMGTFNANKNSDMLERTWTVASSFLNSLLKLFYHAISIENANIMKLILIFLLSTFLWKSIKLYTQPITALEKKTNTNQGFYSSLLFIGGAVSAHIISVSATAKIVSFNEVGQFHTGGRQWFVQAVLVLLALWQILNIFYRTRNLVLFFATTLIAMALLRFGTPFNVSAQRNIDDYWASASFSNWSEFSKHFEPKLKCAPINPYPWFYGQGCRPLTQLPSYETLQNNLTHVTKLNLQLPTGFTNEKIRLIGFFINKNSSKARFRLDVYNGDGTYLTTFDSIKSNEGPFVFFWIERGFGTGTQTLSLRKEDQSSFEVGLPDATDLQKAALLFGLP